MNLPVRGLSLPKEYWRPVRIAASILAVLALSGGGARGETTFPEPYNSEPDASARPPSPEDSVAMFQLPAGFAVSLFASEPEVQNPIALAWDPGGRLWVAENYTYAERQKRFDLDLRDRVIILEDKDWDGRADKRTVFADDLQMLTSVEVGRGGAWVLCPPRLLFIPDRDGDDVPDGEPQVVLDGFTVAQSNYHNFANGLRWGPDGWLYGRCGHSCPGRIGIPGTPDSQRIPIEGGMWRYHPEVRVVEVLTHGTTNPWGHDWDRHGELFFINTVNGHLWHNIPGAHFTESFGGDPHPFVYERIDTHADHYHYDRGAKWSESRSGAADAFGGGHAHIGMMIYQGDRWPERFHDRLFTLNMHGFRTNVERLDPEGSGYVGRHEPDVFLTSDRWFRGIDIRQGPDDSVFVLDWSDTGECHDHTGVHRTSGRIYRISHGRPEAPALELLANCFDDDAEKVEAALRALLSHPNPFYERQFRSILRGRQSEPSHVIGIARQWLQQETEDPVLRLRALWLVHQFGELERGLARLLLDDANPHLRSWGIRLLTDFQPIDTIVGPLQGREIPALDEETFRSLEAMAVDEESAAVRLTLASTLQRLPLAQRARLGRRLVERGEDADDHNLPAMIWYGISPLAAADPEVLLDLAEDCRLPSTLKWISRALAAGLEEHPKVWDQLFSRATGLDTKFQRAILEGANQGLQGFHKAPKPEGWDNLSAVLAGSGDEALVQLSRELSVLFGDGRALEDLKRLAQNKQADEAMRRAALETLIENRPEDLRDICERLLDDRLINDTAVRGLAGFDDPKLGEALAKRYRRFYPAKRPGVIEVLVSRPAWARALLEEMKEGGISRSDLTAFQARQVKAFDDESLGGLLAEVWGEVRDSDEAKRELIESWTAKLGDEALAEADLSAGRRLYAAICGACHVMYGQGGEIGPDLTGSNRADLGYLLENIFDPGAVVDADYRMSVLELEDGRILTGVVADEGDRSLILRQANAELTVTLDEIAERKVSSFSMMPEGLLQSFGDDQVRDLIAYLKHPVQVPLPEAAN